MDLVGKPRKKKDNAKKFLVYYCDNRFVNFFFISAKFVGMASDGASNMVGVKGGLATLLRQDINSELVNVHCLAHHLELAFRDVLKKNKIYDKIMTLMVGLYYFYKKSYNNKKSLLNSIKVCQIDGLMPPKVTLVGPFI